MALGNVGQSAEALRVLSDAIAREPQNELLVYERAQIETHNGDTASAEADLRKALVLRPDYADALNNLGSLLAQSGDVPGAESRFRHALAVNPYDPGARANLGRLLTAKGSLVEAAFELQRSVELAPNDAETRLNYAIALLESNDIRHSEPQIRAALKINPVSPRGLDLMGQIDLMRRQPIQARAEFEAALKSDPSFGPAQLDLAETLLEFGSPESAIPLLEQAKQSASPAVAARAEELFNRIHPRNDCPAL